MRTALLLALACLAPASTASDPGPQEAARASDPGRVRVVVLAGQSNMEGKATNDLFET